MYESNILFSIDKVVKSLQNPAWVFRGNVVSHMDCELCEAPVGQIMGAIRLSLPKSLLSLLSTVSSTFSRVCFTRGVKMRLFLLATVITLQLNEVRHSMSNQRWNVVRDASREWAVRQGHSRRNVPSASVLPDDSSS